MTQTPMDKGFESKDELITRLRGQIKEWVAERDYFEKLKNEYYELWKAAEAREQRLIEVINRASDKIRHDYPAYRLLQSTLSTLYPDTPAPTPENTARHIDDWHEDMGAVLWWEFPVEEPPYCGTPMDQDWPGYHTHWTPLVIPAAPKEGNDEASEIKRCD